MTSDSDPTGLQHLLPLGELSLLVLLALRGSPSHGYAIGREVEARSNGRLKPTTGALYQALRRLEASGLLEPTAPPEPAVDSRRKYFRITELGRAAVGAETARLEELIAVARGGSLATDGR